MASLQKGTKVISFSMIAVALLFLFNPNIAVIDPLPDFIGYILLCASIGKLADIHERLGEAYVAFKKMIFIDGSKLLAIIWIFGMSVPSEQSASIMLWSFVFSVFECIFLLPAYAKLFDGITQIGYLYTNDSVFGKNKRVSHTDRVKLLTYVFVILKALLAFLPELADLTNLSYDEAMGSGVINLYRYIGLLRAMAFIPAFLLGIIWLFAMIGYFKRIRKDFVFLSLLAEKYDRDIRPKTGIFVRKAFFTFSVLFTIALVLTIDVRIDDYNIFPDFLAAAFFILSFIYLVRYNGQKQKDWIWSSIGFSVFSVASSLCEYFFFEKYYYGAIIKSDEARVFYIVLVIINLVKSCCLVWVFADMYRAVCKAIDLHTGFVVGMERTERTEAKMVSAVQNDLKKDFIRGMVFAGVYILSDICFDAFAPRVNFMGLINIGAAIVCIFFFVRALSSIRDAIETKYMLE